MNVMDQESASIVIASKQSAMILRSALFVWMADAPHRPMTAPTAFETWWAGSPYAKYPIDPEEKRVARSAWDEATRLARESAAQVAEDYIPPQKLKRIRVCVKYSAEMIAAAIRRREEGG